MPSSAVFHLLLLCVALSAADVADYNKRVEVLQKMSTAREKYLRTYMYDSDKRAQHLNDLLAIYRNEFKKTDEWILNGLKTNGPDSLVKETYTKNFFDVAKTLKFIEEASSNMMLAFSLNFWCNAVSGGEEAEAIRLRNLAVSARREVDSVLKTTSDYLRGGWKEDLKQDVDSWARANKDKGNPTVPIVQSLTEKFTNGNWLVVIYKYNEWKTECSLQGDFFYKSYAVADRILLVVRANRDRNFDSASANSLLGKISGSRITRCSDYSSNIMRESGYSCNNGKYAFFGVISDDAGYTKFSATRDNLFVKKRVYRGSFLCNYYYVVIIFG